MICALVNGENRKSLKEYVEKGATIVQPAWLEECRRVNDNCAVDEYRVDPSTKFGEVVSREESQNNGEDCEVS